MAGRPRKTVATKDEKASAASAVQEASEGKTEKAAEAVGAEIQEAQAPETKKAEPKKPGRKPAAKKLEEAGNAVKSAAEKVEKTAKSAAAKAEETAKSAAVKAEKKASETARKVTAAAKKAKAAETFIVVQHAGRDISPKKLLDDAKAAWLAKGNKESGFKSIELYINVDENRYYPVINGEEQGGFEI